MSPDSNNEAMYGVWTGLNDITTEDLFHWPNGSQVTYERWSEGQPDNAHGYQNCVQMKVNYILPGGLEDSGCDKILFTQPPHPLPLGSPIFL